MLTKEAKNIKTILIDAIKKYSKRLKSADTSIHLGRNRVLEESYEDMDAMQRQFGKEPQSKVSEAGIQEMIARKNQAHEDFAKELESIAEQIRAKKQKEKNLIFPGKHN